ncbi:MAG: hypothetical protein K2X77_30500 [Candidatus Obscuribacterales bacterium]|nr:hypothetical protein [Candidatus Obscuribacterales bacterium]
MSSRLHLFKYLLLIGLCSIVGACGGVSEPAHKSPAQQQHIGPAASSSSEEVLPRPESEIQQLIEKMAKDADNTVVDGWFFGQEARLLKSFYRKVEPADKAKFAVAYHKWIRSKNQDMVRNFESYVPYSQRASFARDWWSKENPRFLKQETKYQVLWMHESIEDAGELWWRAVEKLRESPVSSMEVLAHDEEQKMVSKFMESSRSPHGSISDQIWKATHK